MRGKVKVKKDRRLKELVPKYRKNRLLIVIQKENHSCLFKWINRRTDSFRIDGHTYFISQDGMYLSSNNILVSYYYEGISTPMSHDNIEKEIQKREYIGYDGKKHSMDIPVIKGLKWDSNVIDMMLNRKLADEFTRIGVDFPQIIIIILLIASIGISIVSLGLQVG